MSSRFLLFEVRLHDGRWHGAPEWPPSPFRLFQALLAGAARGAALDDGDREALLRLEAAKPEDAPIIAVPPSRFADRAVRLYVPNNDLDAVGGDPARIGAIRAPKLVRPRLFETDAPVFLYALPAHDVPDEAAAALCEIADRLYQFGRGVDMACARAELLSADQLEARLARHGGAVHRPSSGGAGGAVLRCPAPGSLASLIARRRGLAARLARPGELRQAAPARFRMVAYDCPPTQLLFELAAPADSGRRFRPWPLVRCVTLTERVRDRAAARLARAMPDREKLIERILKGRGAGESDKALRPRITPVPSIGAAHTDASIRRVLVDIPPDCPLAVDDLAWAFAGLDLGVNAKTGEIADDGAPVLTSAADRSMLDRHYLRDATVPDEPAVWRTATPAALPVARGRGRQNGSARIANEKAAAAAVRNALRHAGVSARCEAVRVQREPFSARGARAEDFAQCSRFDPDRLWHVEIALAGPVAGPLVIGDGRFLGLGLMAPAKPAAVARRFLLSIDPARPMPVGETLPFAEAVRSALMGCWRAEHGDDLPSWLSGHQGGGRNGDAVGRAGAAASAARVSSALREGAPAHLFVAPCDRDGDGFLDSALVIAPPALSERVARQAAQLLRTLRVVVRDGVRLAAISAVAAELPQRARIWRSATPYLATRFPKGHDLASFIASDVARECLRAGLPAPRVGDLSEAAPGWTVRRRAAQFDRRGWLLTLSFAAAVEGPFCLGRHRHFGMGAFAPAG